VHWGATLPLDRDLERTLWYVLGGARGGHNRARIILTLNNRPRNLNQLAEDLNVDYRTIMHHMHVLQENSLVVSEGNGYGAVYFLSPRLEAGLGSFREICLKLHFDIEEAESG